MMLLPLAVNVETQMAASHASEGAGPLKTQRIMHHFADALLPHHQTTTVSHTQGVRSGKCLQTQTPCLELSVHWPLTYQTCRRVLLCRTAPKAQASSTKLHTAYVPSRVQGEPITRLAHQSVPTFCFLTLWDPRRGVQKVQD